MNFQSLNHSSPRLYRGWLLYSYVQFIFQKKTSLGSARDRVWFKTLMHIRDDSWHHRSWQLEVHLPILIVLTHLQMVSWHWGTSPTIQNIPKPLVFPWFSPKNHLKTTHNLGLKSPEIPRTQSQHVPPVSWEPNSSTADPAGDWALENPPRYRPSEIGDAWSSQHFLYLKAHHNSKSHIVIYICVYNNIHYIHILYI